MRKIAVTMCLLLFTWKSAAAQLPYPEAPEKWSEPVKVRELSLGSHPFAAQPTLTADGKTIYYYYYSDTSPGGIYSAKWQDSSWSVPVRLNGNVNQSLAEGPSVSPDGKRLYFRMYGRADGYGGWDLYYSDWDSVTRDWGPAKNLGPNINRADIDEWSCMTPDNKHLYWTRYPSLPRISTWNDTTQTWGPSQWVDLYRFLSAYGRAAATRNQRKIYYDPFVETLNPHDIYVNYYDTVAMAWSYPMVLNINKMMDTVVSSALYGYRRIQQDPWISPDGKTLYFSSTHDSTWDIWTSKLLIDENGIPLGVRDRDHALRESFRLYQNYPNPFNPVTIIEYEIPRRAQVQVAVFDLVGRQVVTLVSEQKEPGRYRLEWNGRDQYNRQVSSGVYFYRIQVNQRTIVRKMIALR